MTRPQHPSRATVPSIMKPLLLLLAASLVSCASTLRDVVYEPDGHPLQKLDLHFPRDKADEARPVIIAIHGGGWAFGDKSNSGFVQPKTRWLHRHGFIVASINYRLTPEVVHPAHIEDTCRAIAWVQQSIAEHGGDPDRIYLLGHSAGAHLAALAAVDEQRLRKAGADPSAIRGAILLDGAAYHVPRQIEQATLPRVEKMYRDAFTNELIVQKDASPTLKVADRTTPPPPFLILHVATRPASKAQSEGLARSLRAKGGKATVVPIEGKNHSTISRDLGRPGDPTTEAVAEFLDLAPRP